MSFAECSLLTLWRGDLAGNMGGGAREQAGEAWGCLGQLGHRREWERAPVGGDPGNPEQSRAPLFFEASRNIRLGPPTMLVGPRDSGVHKAT